MARILGTLLVVAAMFAAGTAGAGAQGPVPGGDPAFGPHVSAMAPEHPMQHGRMFGECVSTMATTGACPHHE